MKATRILLACLTIASLAQLRAHQVDQEPTQQEQVDQGLQMIFISYEIIDKNCKSIKFELLKNELDQTLAKYFDTCIKSNPTEEEIITQKECLRDILTRIAQHLDSHHTKHNSLEQIGDGPSATVIVCYVHCMPFIQHYASTISKTDELSTRFQQITQDLLNFIPTCFEE